MSAAERLAKALEAMCEEMTTQHCRSSADDAPKYVGCRDCGYVWPYGGDEQHDRLGCVVADGRSALAAYRKEHPNG